MSKTPMVFLGIILLVLALSVSSQGQTVDAAKPEPRPKTSNNWALMGNPGTDPSINFIGTADPQPVIFKSNAIEVMRLTPGGTLHVTGDITVSGTVDGVDLSGLAGLTNYTDAQAV